MSDFFVLIWLLSLIGMGAGGINYFKEKKSKGQKAKTLLLISTIISITSFIGIGITAPPAEETNNRNAIISEKTDNNNATNAEENSIINNSQETNVETNPNNEEKNFTAIKKQELSNIPNYTNAAYIVINNNIPFFNDSDLTTNSYESYSNLDELGRCGVAKASIGKDLMPTEERESIGSIKPTGWHTVKYNGIDGNYLYNRCHLIGYQLTAENANEKNLITGTRYLNVQGMLPFENMVADYIEETENHVLYRVTPIFEGDNLLASGVLMEAKSVEDNGKGIQFNVYCYNVQPGITINYATGESSGPEYTGISNVTDSNKINNTNNTADSSNTTNISNNTLPDTGTTNAQNAENDSSNEKIQNTTNNTTSSETTTKNEVAQQMPNNNETTQSYVLNKNTKKFHEPSCYSADRISEKNREDYSGTRNNLISQGYQPCKNCNP